MIPSHVLSQLGFQSPFFSIQMCTASLVHPATTLYRTRHPFCDPDNTQQFGTVIDYPIRCLKVVRIRTTAIHPRRFHSEPRGSVYVGSWVVADEYDLFTRRENAAGAHRDCCNTPIILAKAVAPADANSIPKGKPTGDAAQIPGSRTRSERCPITP